MIKLKFYDMHTIIPSSVIGIGEHTIVIMGRSVNGKSGNCDAVKYSATCKNSCLPMRDERLTMPCNTITYRFLRKKLIAWEDQHLQSPISILIDELG